MKLIAALLLAASLTGPAYASDYSLEVKRQNMCTAIGEFSVMVFKEKKKGTPLSVITEVVGDSPSPSVQFALDYAFKDAQNNKDAYMTAWAKCMDNSQ